MMKYIFLILSTFSTLIAYASDIDRSRSNFNMSFIEGSHANFNANATLGYNDNFFVSEDDKRSTNYLSFSPELFLQSHNDQHLGQLFAKGTLVNYDSFSEDNHTDASLLGKYYFKLASDNRLFLSASYDSFYELRGVGITQEYPHLTDTGNELENVLVNAGYQYGRVDSISRLNVLVGQSKNEYTSNRSITAIKDHTRSFGHIELDYLVSSQAYISSVVEYEDVEYENDPELTREVASVLVGLKWQATNISALSLLLGYEEVTFEQSEFGKNDNAIWRADYKWSPTENLKLAFNSSRRTEESQRLARSYRTIDNYGLMIRYRMNDYSSLSAKSSFITSDVNYADALIEEDELQLSVSYEYKISERISMSLAIEHNENESDNRELNFDINTIQLNFETHL